MPNGVSVDFFVLASNALITIHGNRGIVVKDASSWTQFEKLRSSLQAAEEAFQALPRITKRKRGEKSDKT